MIFYYSLRSYLAIVWIQTVWQDAIIILHWSHSLLSRGSLSGETAIKRGKERENGEIKKSGGARGRWESPLSPVHFRFPSFQTNWKSSLQGRTGAIKAQVLQTHIKQVLTGWINIVISLARVWSVEWGMGSVLSALSYPVHQSTNKDDN